MSGCELFCNPDGTTNGLATFLAGAVVVLIVAGVVLMVVAYVVTSLTGSRGRRPAPAGSPPVRGRKVRWGPVTYTAPVSAVTPGGVRVSHGRCCQRGHQWPEEAARHAVLVGDRIARTGR